MSPPEASGPPTADAPAPLDAEARRRRTVRFFLVIGAAAVVAVAATFIAVAVSGSSGSGSGTATTSTSASAVTPALPQLSIVLNRTDSMAQMPASDQVVALQAQIASNPTEVRYLDLGQVEMSVADQQAAVSAFAHAQRLAPNTPEPLVGLAMAEAMPGTAGALAAANAQLLALQSRFPNSQVVAFNVGWLALYRRDPATVKAAWQHAIQLGKQTPLGIAATVLLAQTGKKTTK